MGKIYELFSGDRQNAESELTMDPAFYDVEAQLTFLRTEEGVHCLTKNLPWRFVQLAIKNS